MKKSKNYCFTINNYVFADMLQIIQIPAQYICFGFEKGEKGTPHIQGYIHFTNQRYFEAVKKEFPQKTHIERCKGTIQNNIDYCMKEGDWYEFGKRPNQGERTDLEEIKECIQGGIPDYELATQYFSQWVQYRKSFDAYKQLHMIEYINPEIEEKETITDAINALPEGSHKFTYVDIYHAGDYNGQTIGIIHQNTTMARAITMGFIPYENHRKVLFEKIYIYKIL